MYYRNHLIQRSQGGLEDHADANEVNQKFNDFFCGSFQWFFPSESKFLLTISKIHKIFHRLHKLVIEISDSKKRYLVDKFQFPLPHFNSRLDVHHFFHIMNLIKCIDIRMYRLKVSVRDVYKDDVN